MKSNVALTVKSESYYIKKKGGAPIGHDAEYGRHRTNHQKARRRARELRCEGKRERCSSSSIWKRKKRKEKRVRLKENIKMMSNVKKTIRSFKWIQLLHV